MDDVVDGALEAGARVGIAVLVLGAGYVLAVILRRMARRLIARPTIARTLGPSVSRLVVTAVFYVVLLLAAGVALVVLGVSPTTVTLAAVVLVLLLGLALRQSLADFAATVSFLLFQPFRRGELIETMGHMGAVQEILLLTTVLALPDQRVVSLPNSKVHESGVVNYSRLGKVWSSFTLTVPYSEDLDRVRAVISDVVAADPRVMADPPFQVVVDDLGDHGVRLLLMPSVEPEHFWAARNDLRERIKSRFDAEGIRFAVPPRDVRFSMTAPANPLISAEGPRDP